MDSLKTAATYNSLSEFWNRPDFPNENGIAAHTRAVQFSSSKTTAIDIGCGSNPRILEFLSRNGFQIEGLDLSKEMLKAAQSNFPDATFHHSDIASFEFPHQYDFITAWDSIWHVPLTQQAAVIKKLCTALIPGGVLIFSAGGFDEPGEETGEMHGYPIYHATLGIPHLLEIIRENHCILRHLEYDQPESESNPGKHLYLIVQRSST